MQTPPSLHHPRTSWRTCSE